jgi:hypothetical protein
MADVSLDRQLTHAYIDKLPPDQLAAIRSLLERILESPGPHSFKDKGVSMEDALSNLGLTLEEFKRLSTN